MKCRCLVCFLGILLLVSCSTRTIQKDIVTPETISLEETAYKDNFSKTFIRFVNELSLKIPKENRRNNIVIIGLKKYTPEFYTVKVFNTNIEYFKYMEYIGQWDDAMYYKSKYFYVNDLTFILNLMDEDLYKFHEFNLLNNFGKIVTKREYRKYKRENYFIHSEGDYLDFYTMNNIDYKYQLFTEWFLFCCTWSMEDDLLPSFKNKLKPDIVNVD